MPREDVFIEYQPGCYKYMEDYEGVHLMSPVTDKTLCGELFRRGEPTHKTKVTCYRCLHSPKYPKDNENAKKTKGAKRKK
jgi:hypothetical protein